MVVYKLHYFDLTGLGEAIRFLFHYGGIKFEDVRYDLNTWGEKDRKKFPLGQMPMLEVDDKKFVQSIPICRYLAKQVGLTGNNDLENLEIDALVETFNDIRLKISKYMWDDKDTRREKHKQLLEETIPFYFKRLDELAEANGGFFACKRLTWADIFVVSFSKYVNFSIQEVIQDYEGYPNIQKVTANVLANENIKKWVETRPDTFC